MVNLISPKEINQYKAARYAVQKEGDIKAKGSRNPETGGDSGFSMQYEFNGLADQSIIVGLEYKEYNAFDDEPSFKKDCHPALKILAGMGMAIAVGGLVAGAIALLGPLGFTAIAGVATIKIAIGAGIVTAVAGGLATLGTYINDKKNDTISSINEYVQSLCRLTQRTQQPNFNANF